MTPGWRRVDAGLAPGWRRVGAGLVPGWRRIGAGLAPGWRRVTGTPGWCSVSAGLVPRYCHTAIEVGVQHLTLNFIRFICQVNKVHAARLVPVYCHAGWCRVSAGLLSRYRYIEPALLPTVSAPRLQLALLLSHYMPHSSIPYVGLWHVMG